MQEREPRTKLIMKKRTALMMELSPQDALAHFAEKNGTVAAARIAASSVLNKLTASLPMRPCRSSEAPRMLSKNIPAAAAPRQFGTCCHGSNPTAADIPAITAADKTPDTVPIMLTAPLVPAGTDSQVVIRRLPQKQQPSQPRKESCGVIRSIGSHKPPPLQDWR